MLARPQCHLFHEVSVTRSWLPLAALAALTTSAAMVAAPASAQTIHGPTPYLSFLDSPFAGGAYSYFHLEDFEDGLLNTPGASMLESGWSVLGPAPLTDSVDGDDGAVDGSGAGGHSLYSNLATTSFTVEFDAATLGALPTVAGIVWTDVGQTLSGPFGVGAVTFEAFDAALNSLGGTGPFTLGDGLFAGETAEDRFFGVTYAGGIRRIVISTTNSVDWEADHLQYGRVAATATPEPLTLALVATGLGLVGAARRRRA